MAYLFIIAMAYGIHYNKRKPIPPGKSKASISKNFLENQFGWLIRAVAISESKEGVEIIPDEAQIYEVASQYANGGIEIIKKALTKSKPGEFEDTMERELDKINKDESQNDD